MKPSQPILLACVLIFCMAAPAQAYIGPGAGIGLIGSVIGMVLAILTAVGVIFFWPIRRLIKRRRNGAPAAAMAAEGAEKADPSPDS